MGGKKVTTAAQWLHQRKPEILRLYEENVYGRTPAKKVRLRISEAATAGLECDHGTAIRKANSHCIYERCRWAGHDDPALPSEGSEAAGSPFRRLEFLRKPDNGRGSGDCLAHIVGAPSRRTRREAPMPKAGRSRKSSHAATRWRPFTTATLLRIRTTTSKKAYSGSSIKTKRDRGCRRNGATSVCGVGVEPGDGIISKRIRRLMRTRSS